MTLAIGAASLSKRYRLGASVDAYKTLREVIDHTIRARVRSPRSSKASVLQKDAIWALRDVSFEIHEGEIVGIIGRNGAGKTTLLKILSRITQPTSGWATVRGRVGSLLEVGTGFHPELTGRENTYLSGTILGMGRAEIDRRFDEIVAFAGIEDFLDTPIKRYSSGMKIRLAFAVAAHLEPEILIVDEVLAVGDIAFQKKCLGKMGEVVEEGRTVLFVSHNMSILQALCTRGILLEAGRLAVDANIGDAIGRYLRDLEEQSSSQLVERADRTGAQEVKVRSVSMSGTDGAALMTGAPARFVFDLTETVPQMVCRCTIYNHIGQPITTLSSEFLSIHDRHDLGLEPRFECWVDELLLLPGRYRLDVAVASRGVLQDSVDAAAFFDVEQGALRQRALIPDAYGNVVFPHVWRTPSL
jgi:lipopolysaccharide transport system ATP-binding protein